MCQALSKNQESKRKLSWSLRSGSRRQTQVKYRVCELAESTIYRNNADTALGGPWCDGRLQFPEGSQGRSGGSQAWEHWLWRPPPPTATPRDLCRGHFTHKASLSRVWFFPLHVSSDTQYPLLFISAIIFTVYTHTHTHTPPEVSYIRC